MNCFCKHIDIALSVCGNCYNEGVFLHSLRYECVSACMMAACVGVHVCVGGRTSHAPRHSMPSSIIPK